MTLTQLHYLIVITETKSLNKAAEQLYMSQPSLTSAMRELGDCQAYVYIWKDHPLAKGKSICFEQLKDYPCLSFEQGDNSSFYLAEEILSNNEYSQMIRANDRATMLNLMAGLNGYTLCSGIICEELNGSDYLTVPFGDDERNQNSVMEIEYVTGKNTLLSQIGGSVWKS